MRFYFVRFIPTGVGNTSSNLPRCSGGPVHPHGCGEHCVFSLLQKFCVGSSPRVWGTRHSGPARRRTVRFIPTGVGNTPIITD